MPAIKRVDLSAGAFTVDLTAEDVMNLASFQTDLIYDPAIVSVSGVSVAAFLGSTGRTVAPVGPTIDNLAGKVTFGAFSLRLASGRIRRRHAGNDHLPAQVGRRDRAAPASHNAV